MSFDFRCPILYISSPAMIEKTPLFKKEEIPSRWHLVDAREQVLGRLAARVALLLRGKHKPQFMPNVDLGDHVVIVNAQKVRLTGEKATKKIYYDHSGYPGGLKWETAGKRHQEKPERLVYEAIRGMLPKTKLGKAMIKKLRVYRGGDHPHQAQSPEPIDLGKRKGAGPLPSHPPETERDGRAVG